MKKMLIITLLVLINQTLHAEVRLSIIKTGQAKTYEWLTLKNGDWRQVIANHSAFLIEHPKGNILVDTGLGEKIDDQFKADMPLIHRIGFAYEKGVTAKQQLSDNKVDVSFILLTHLHFDHVSGLLDFPEKGVWALPEEIAFKDQASAPAVLISQVNSPEIKWKPYQLKPQPFMGFSESFDVFNDQSVVIVPLRGHTPGSVGIIVSLTNGKKIFLIGDTVWRKKGVDQKLPKFWLSSKLVDLDKDKVQKEIEGLYEFQKTYPEVIIMPSHDQSVQEQFGYFPTRLN